MTHPRPTTLQRLIPIIYGITGARPESITAETNLDLDLQIDELDGVEIGMEIEQDFNLPVGAIDITRIEPNKNLTVADVVKIIDETIAAAGGAE